LFANSHTGEAASSVVEPNSRSPACSAIRGKCIKENSCYRPALLVFACSR
jgi:hypothetical protein